MAKLEDLGIEYTLHHHEAVFTVEESEKLDSEIPGTHCRNLFLRDKKKKKFPRGAAKLNRSGYEEVTTCYWL